MPERWSEETAELVARAIYDSDEQQKPEDEEVFRPIPFSLARDWYLRNAAKALAALADAGLLVEPGGETRVEWGCRHLPRGAKHMSYPHFRNECDEHHGLVRDFGGAKPRITVLCGSTRFYDAFQQANYDLTMAGHIVLSVGFYPHATAEHGHGEGVGHDSEQKVALDELHKRKIDLADEVLVLNVGGYIGASTRSEIEYAIAIGRPISYLERNPS